MTITIEGAVKRYGSNPVVNNVSLQMDDAELLVLIGPSGSGKSTLLRMIAGLSPMDAGQITLHGRDVTHVPPQQRGVGFVFQNYALFRHMSAADNVEYGLKVRRVPAAKRRARVAELLELVGLDGLGRRLPSQLSGGQQQRVALARALAFRPEVLLLDEPFGALDAKIRADLRRSVRRIQREIGISTIFVTHDQEEAFALADRVGVMHDGQLVEVGPSEELYHAPRHQFTATFLGGANLILGLTTSKGVRIGQANFPLFDEDHLSDASRLAKVLVRPEEVVVSKYSFDDGGRFVCEGRVTERTFCGASERLRVQVTPAPSLQVLHPSPVFGSAEAFLEVLRTRQEMADQRLQPGDEVYVGFRRVHCLDVASSLPVLGGRHAIEFLESAQQEVLPAGPGQMESRQVETQQLVREGPGGVAMSIDQDKVLVWFGEPRRIERVLINLTGHEPRDRALVQFARQMFSSGRPPAITLFLSLDVKSMINSSAQRFMLAAKRELMQLETAVQINHRTGEALNELRQALREADYDLLLSELPDEAHQAHANGELSAWVVDSFGPVASMFFRTSDAVHSLTERAA